MLEGRAGAILSDPHDEAMTFAAVRRAARRA